MHDAAAQCMTKFAAPFPIVVALDDSEYSEIVLEHALDQAARHAAPILHFVRVVDDDDQLDLEHERLAAQVREAVETFAIATPLHVHVRAGKPVAEISNLVAEVRAKLFVVGRYHVQRRFRSTADLLLGRVTCPTLVVGFADDAPDSVAQCPACVALRERSVGEIWFCSEHAAPGRMRLTSIVPSPTTDSRGGVW